VEKIHLLVTTVTVMGMVANQIVTENLRSSKKKEIRSENMEVILTQVQMVMLQTTERHNEETTDG
jgi:Na+-transporting methylmalonyl-CoA/oxaloacetate decarboxylase gamma subunit